ncbi:tRNA (cytidine(34)-2'-O)-methyltransferase [Microbaculum marinum]|uniref:tRNA (cytidine(34)-2'-O)-methyltransferase n=1 Tax=Microbaculum marinum TaxID=1764581 RepID=A0AAW9RES6_9HYPH
MIRLALYQPDIPQNAGTLMRLGACLDVTVEIIEPAGFPVSERAFRRAGMDYLDQVSLVRHVSFADFARELTSEDRRMVLLTTRSTVSYADFHFRPTDTLLVGRESSGVPDKVHEAADARIAVPMKRGLRSLNVAVAAAMVLGEALRQTGGFPAGGPATAGRAS